MFHQIDALPEFSVIISWQRQDWFPSAYSALKKSWNFIIKWEQCWQKRGNCGSLSTKFHKKSVKFSQNFSQISNFNFNSDSNCSRQIKFQKNCNVQFSYMILHQILMFDLTRLDLDKMNKMNNIATYRTLFCNSLRKTSEPNIHYLIESESRALASYITP